MLSMCNDQGFIALHKRKILVCAIQRTEEQRAVRKPGMTYCIRSEHDGYMCSILSKLLILKYIVCWHVILLI